MAGKIQPIVRKIEDNIQELQRFQDELVQEESSKEEEILLHFPTVYIHNWKKTGEYEVYIGESNDIVQRTKQHYDDRRKTTAGSIICLRIRQSLYIIGHEHFNKSMTLDIENR